MTDYDRTGIPARYDSGRDHGPEMVALWMEAIATHVNQRPRRILDLGCGTGRFSDALAVRFRADVVGVDPSLKMIERAAQKPRSGRVYYQLGRAEAIPLCSGSIDLIFMSMSLHHFKDAQLAAAECRRVLGDHRCVFVRTGTREQMSAYPYYSFFPASHPILEEVLPTSVAIRETFEEAGLELAAQDKISQTVAPDWDAYADKLAANADSVLARLTPEEFDRGIAAVRRHASSCTTTRSVSRLISSHSAHDPRPARMASSDVRSMDGFSEAHRGNAHGVCAKKRFCARRCARERGGIGAVLFGPASRR